VCTNGNGKLSGVLTVTSVSCTSDNRLKTDINPIENALNNIINLQGIEYKSKINCEGCYYGLIAQDSCEYIPYSVNQVTTDLTEKELINDDLKYTMDYASIVPILIESVKEQQKEIEIMKNDILKLKKCQI
jgi:hypothetical protein